MKNTQFEVEDVSDEIIRKDLYSQEPITKLKKFLANLMWRLILVWR